ncbi:MAG: ABC transporter permease, partial [Candidatus Desulfobacillus denitrificans]
MTPVLLWTDALVFLLVACGIASGIYISRREYLLASWHRVGESRAGMASLTLLVAFVVVGLLDSLHYRPRLEAASGQPGGYSGEVRSLLDVLLQPLRDGTEKTYSAPLAAHLYARETVELPDGSQARVFPRLKHGGAHLADVEAEWGRDVTLRTLRGAALAVLAGLTFVALAVLFAAR